MVSAANSTGSSTLRRENAAARAAAARRRQRGGASTSTDAAGSDALQHQPLQPQQASSFNHLPPQFSASDSLSRSSKQFSTPIDPSSFSQSAHSRAHTETSIPRSSAGKSVSRMSKSTASKRTYGLKNDAEDLNARLLGLHNEEPYAVPADRSVEEIEEDILNVTIEEEDDPQQDPNLVDAACFKSQDSISIRSHGLLYLHHQDAKHREGETTKRNNTQTSALWMELRPDSSDATPLVMKCEKDTKYSNKPLVLRYNDLVRFQFRKKGSGERLFFGARAVLLPGDESKIVFRVGLFPEVHQWTVLRGSLGRKVRVGSDASAALLTKSDPIHHPYLRSGDPIVLRHVETGGILSVANGEDGDDSPFHHLRLVTDAYDRPSNDSSRSAILNSNQIKVTPADIFHFHLTAVPPIPLWMASRLDKRFYQDMSYLQQSSRNDSMAKLDPRKHRDFPDYLGQMKVAKETELRTLQGQQRFLINEVLGAFLGLEGDCIAIQTTECPMSDLSFTVVESFPIDMTLRRIVLEMLPLANSYIRVSHFATSRSAGYEYGTVMQAFCQAIDSVLQEYVVYIANLEQLYRSSTDSLLLRRLQVQTKSSLHIMSVIERATRCVMEKKGGSLLNALRRLKIWTYEGDEVACKTLGYLLECASVPYMNILHNWLERGRLTDQFGEFMVKKDELRDWENSYVLVEENVLEGIFVNMMIVDRVVATGKYWNAVLKSTKGKPLIEMESGTTSTGKLDDALSYGTSATAISSFVQSMYYKASQSLEKLLFIDYDLFSALRLMRRYFLLDQGDFFVHFLDAAEDELLREVQDVSVGRIRHWLTSSIQMSEKQDEESMINSIRSRDRLKIIPSDFKPLFASESLLEQLDKIHAGTGGIETHDLTSPQRHIYGGITDGVLKGLDAFILDLPSIPFPLSLVLSKQSLEGYQLLFRHIFLAKHVERRLVGIWQDHQAIKELQDIRGSFGKTFLLRQRMLHFMQNLIYYIMFEIVEPNWSKLEADIRDARSSIEGTIDDILEIHSNFLYRTRESCLLTNRNLVRALTKVTMTCLMFSDQMKQFMAATGIQEEQQELANEKQNQVQRSLNNRGLAPTRVSMENLQDKMKKDRNERHERINKRTARIEREISNESYQRMINRFDEVFSDHLRSFMTQLTRSDELFHTHKVNLCIQLDYNGFIAQNFDLSRTTGSRP